MKIKIIALGKVHEQYLKDGINEFLRRISPYATIEILELQPVEIKDMNLKSKALDMEADKILSYIKPSSYVITLEIEGKSISSEDFSNQIKEIINSGFHKELILN